MSERRSRPTRAHTHCSKPKPDSKTNGRSPVRALSTSVLRRGSARARLTPRRPHTYHTLLRKLLKPHGLPSTNGEFAKSAVAMGCGRARRQYKRQWILLRSEKRACSARPTRNFFTMSSSEEKSRFTCTVQVRNIMSSPMVPTLGMYSRMIL